MNIIVLLRMVPDVVEELEIAPGGKSLNAEFIRLIPSESDDHALEEALILKERCQGKVTVVAPGAPEIDDALYTALAKGADRALKVGDSETGMGTRAVARVLARALSGLLPADLILTGAQAFDDLDGLLAPLLAHELGLPYLGIVTAVSLDGSGRVAAVTKEYPGGVHGEFEVELPAVLGIQSAEKPPRYMPVAKVRAAMKTQTIETLPRPDLPVGAEIEVLRMSKPEAAGRADMLEGGPDEVAGKLCGVLSERGLL